MSRALRIIDANLNRLTEALKTTEDILRLELADEPMTEAIRALRVKMEPILRSIRPRAIPYRRSDSDLGRAAGFDRTARRDLGEVLSAALKRAQEAARVLEEVCKVDEPACAARFKAIRFRLYDLERDAVSHLARRADYRLYVVVDTATTGRRNLAGIGRELARSRAGIVQLREPEALSTRSFLQDARTLKRSLQGSGTRLIINNRVDIALAVGADGVHVGQTDMPAAAARRLLPANRIVGVSVTSVQQARRAEQVGVDYLGVGAVFPTASKLAAPVIGLAGLERIRRATRLPLVAIGGIDTGNCGRVMRAGADGVALIAAVFGAGRIRENLRVLARLLS